MVRAQTRTVMTPKRLLEWFKTKVSDVNGEPGFYTGHCEDWEVYLIYNEDKNRMRLMVPVRSITHDDKHLMWEALAANYDRALDAKYAINDGILWSTFLHPLDNIGIDGLNRGFNHVTTLAKNTGSTFSSSDMKFRGVPRT